MNVLVIYVYLSSLLVEYFGVQAVFLFKGQRRIGTQTSRCL